MRATHTPAEQSRLARTNDRSSAPLWQSRLCIVVLQEAGVKVKFCLTLFLGKKFVGGGRPRTRPPPAGFDAGRPSLPIAWCFLDRLFCRLRDLLTRAGLGSGSRTRRGNRIMTHDTLSSNHRPRRMPGGPIRGGPALGSVDLIQAWIGPHYPVLRGKRYAVGYYIPPPDRRTLGDPLMGRHVTSRNRVNFT